jgi:DHA1 family bicyclomycin/chloramphenicol resistance-like MFS transporter
MRRIDQVLLVGVLGLLTSFAPMSIDMYLPALPAIGAGFAVSQAAVQGSLSGFFFGFGLGQLFWGPVGDWLGRRWPSAAGILLYLAGCVGCALAGDIAELTLWRVVQALGACAAPVLARAMVRDTHEGARAASVMSAMMLVGSIAPMVAPLIGGQVLRFLDWRAIFWVLSGFGVLGMLGLFSIGETLPRERRTGAPWLTMLGSYARLLRDRHYLGHVLGGACIYGGMFAYISGTPFVYITIYGVGPQYYGLLFGLNVVGMMLANSLNGWLVLRVGAARMLRLGCALAGIFGLLLLAIASLGVGGLPGLVVGIFLFVSLMGVIAPNAMAGALAEFPQIAGAASALAGTLQFLAGALAGWLVGELANGTAVPMASVIAAMGLGCAGALLLLRRHPG